MQDITIFMRAAVLEVFSTMLSLDVTCDEQIPEECAAPFNLSGVTGSVSFTGKMTGTVYLNLTTELGAHCASQILGIDEKRGNEEINDVVGELTNMVTGNIKSKMSDRGYNCRLSIPIVIRGKEVSIDSSEASISICSFFKIASTGETFSVQVFARLEE